MWWLTYIALIIIAVRTLHLNYQYMIQRGENNFRAEYKTDSVNHDKTLIYQGLKPIIFLMLSILSRSSREIRTILD